MRDYNSKWTRTRSSHMGSRVCATLRGQLFAIFQPDDAPECLICGRTDVRLVRDHNHKTGTVRGRLCEHCNTYVGTLESESEWLRNKRQTKKRFQKWLNAYQAEIVAHLKRDTGVPYVARPYGPKFELLLRRWVAGGRDPRKKASSCATLPRMMAMAAVKFKITSAPFEGLYVQDPLSRLATAVQLSPTPYFGHPEEGTATAFLDPSPSSPIQPGQGAPTVRRQLTAAGLAFLEIPA